MGGDEVALVTCNTETEALMLVDILRGEGIPAVLVSVGVGQGGLGASVWRPFQIRVRSADLERAREVLADLEADEADETDTDEADKEEE